MSSTALRAVRELRGDVGDSRPGTSSGVRPGSVVRLSTPEDLAPAAASKDLDDTRLALEKERRAVRALEQYLSEVVEAKDGEIKEALLESNRSSASLQKAEAHAVAIEEMYKAQVCKLVATVERLQAKPPSAREAEESFSAVLREEMRAMQQAYQLKLDRAQSELTAKSNDYAKQLRTLNESLTEERRKNAAMMDKMARGPTSPTAAATPRPNSGSTTAMTAATTKTNGATSARGNAPISATTGSSTAVKPTVKPAVKK
jgi:myosin heavy subunit